MRIALQEMYGYVFQTKTRNDTVCGPTQSGKTWMDATSTNRPAKPETLLV